jgi:hypothetical protein
MPNTPDGPEDIDLNTIPVRVDITVLPADPPAWPIGFRIYERAGSPLRFTDRDEYLREIGDLQPGMRVLAWGSIATVERIEATEPGDAPRAYGHLNGNLVFFEYEAVDAKTTEETPIGCSRAGWQRDWLTCEGLSVSP